MASTTSSVRGRNPAIVRRVETIERVGRRVAMDLEHRALQLSRAHAAARRDRPVNAPATRRMCGEHARRDGRHALPHRRDERLGYGERDESRLSKRLGRGVVGRALAARGRSPPRATPCRSRSDRRWCPRWPTSRRPTRPARGTRRAGPASSPARRRGADDSAAHRRRSRPLHGSVRPAPLSSNGNAPAPPITRSPSHAACTRSAGRTRASAST
jgi:hypothetical protein